MDPCLCWQTGCFYQEIWTWTAKTQSFPNPDHVIFLTEPTQSPQLWHDQFSCRSLLAVTYFRRIMNPDKPQKMLRKGLQNVTQSLRYWLGLHFLPISMQLSVWRTCLNNKSDPWSPGRICCYRCGTRSRTPSEVLSLAMSWRVGLVLAARWGTQHTIIDRSLIVVYARIDTHCTCKFTVHWHTQAQKVHPHTQTHTE